MAIESKMKPFPNRSSVPFSSEKQLPPKKKKKMIFIISFFIVVVFVLIGVRSFLKGPEDFTIPSSLSGKMYQAVFLDNGQVYFGVLQKSRGDFYRLKDVYYIQQGFSALEPNADISLRKLGAEVHGPQDFMDINKEHILFIEDMGENSKVVQAILSAKTD